MNSADDLTSVRNDIADPVRGPAVARRVLAELQPIVEAIGTDDVSGHIQYSDEEAVRRSTALAEVTDRLARMSALAGRWAPVETARVWPQVLATLLGVRDRGNGQTPWLELLAYPALLVEYAFGLGASIGRRFDNLALVLTAPTPDDRKAWQPAVLQLHPGTIQETIAIKLPGAKPRWPLSTHLLSISRPWFTEIVASDALFEREFDRLEVLISLVFYDLQRGDEDRTWSPIGRFARLGRHDRAIHEELLKEGRQAATTSILLSALSSGDSSRVATTMAGFEEHVRRVLGQIW